MRIRTHDAARPRPLGWGRIRRIFQREQPPHRRRKNNKSASKALLVDHDTEPTTDASITTHSQACHDALFPSPKHVGGDDECTVGSGHEKAITGIRPILDRLSVIECSQSHLEVSLVEDEREGRGAGSRSRSGLASRTAVLDLADEAVFLDRGGEAGAEIVLTTSVVQSDDTATRERRTEPEGKGLGDYYGYAHSPYNASAETTSVVQEMVESRWVSEATVASSKGHFVPRVSIITTTTVPVTHDDAHSHREAKPSIGQGSDHSPASDTLTWVSHDQHCALADTRPLKEISFTLLTDASEAGSFNATNALPNAAALSPSVAASRGSSGAATITSLQGNMRVRDAIFASFDAGNGAVAPSAANDGPRAKGEGDDAEADHKSGEAYSQLIEWPDAAEDVGGVPANADAVKPGSDNDKKPAKDLQESIVSESHGSADDSTLSSSSPDDPTTGFSAYALEPSADPPPPGQLVPVSSPKRCAASAFDAVAVLRSPSFDAGLSHLAYKAMQMCGEKSAPGTGDIDTIRKSLSLMDAVSEDEDSDPPDGENTDRTPTESETSGSGLSRCSLPRQLSIPKVESSSKKGTPPHAPRVLIREISTGTEGEESSVASESLTALSNSQTHRSSSSGRSTIDTVDDDGNEYSSNSTREGSSQSNGDDTRLKEYQSTTEGDDDDLDDLEMGEYGSLVPRCLYA